MRLKTKKMLLNLICILCLIVCIQLSLPGHQGKNQGIISREDSKVVRYFGLRFYSVHLTESVCVYS